MTSTVNIRSQCRCGEWVTKAAQLTHELTAHTRKAPNTEMGAYLTSDAHIRYARFELQLRGTR